ncbi:DUF2726 domain-containing protein [Thiocystis violacea]|uniref:DUF2726 domain-containing protein n=1 Tax=Thiocystis violacea TaxID=13725 RepID=UPI001909043C|nr:DUF2726 domain-containing protein [Thiocystis violacea]MBK1722901.1 hypothetical protein [Thiocystis violacea]
MGHFYVLIGLGIVVSLAFLLSLRNSMKRRLRFPYVADETLFTAPERAFKGVLERAVGKEFLVYGRVRAIDVIGPRPRLSRRERERALERLGERCFDFLVCSRESTAILCAVKLAPRSRLRKLPPKDALDRICAAARLPFVRFRESDAYSVVDIEEQIFAAMQARGIRPRIDEIPADEAASVLHGLSSVIEAERRPEPVRPRPRSAPSVTPPRQADSAQRPRPPKPVRRRDPVIQDHHVLDEEPTFKIDGDLEDERPVRSHRL